MKDSELAGIQDDIKRHLSDRARVTLTGLSAHGDAFLVFLETAMPEGKETALALERAKESMMWASSSILENMK